jgi:ribosomal protein S18 acetylase RimI-like enzyme
VTGIRLSRPEDLGALRAIWNASFPGDEAFADWFLKNVYAPERALVWAEDDRAGAMLHLLPVSIVSGGVILPAAYVYAVATLEAHRGKGIASALLEEAASLERARGSKLLVLVPQSESLFGYYRRLGFQDALYRARRLIRRGQAVLSGFTQDDAPDTAELNALYEATLRGRNHILRTDADWGRSLSYLSAVGIRRDGRLRGYAVYDPEGGVRELLATDAEAFAATEQAVFLRLSAPEAVVFGTDGPSEPYGMARALSPDANLSNTYAGLMLD